MKTLSILLCVFVVLLGVYIAIFRDQLTGVIPVIVGTLGFLIIIKDTKKVKGYNPDHWMNR